MSANIKFKKGFDINLAGKAEKKIIDISRPETFALKPADFPGIERPKVVVKEGDTVKAGTPLFFDKKKPAVMYAAPVSGEVVEIKRGEKRKLLEIKILADKNIEYEVFDTNSISDIKTINRDQAKELMLKSGVWPNIVQRPYGIVADPEDLPKSIFISTFDTHPLAPDYDFLLKDQKQYVEAGLEVLKKFSEGSIHLNMNADAEVSPIFSQLKDVTINKFSGPHPAGNVGVQIHHIDPVSKGDIVWTLNPYGLAQIGKLFLTGKYDTSKLIAFTGSELKNPQYYKTYNGACVNKFLENNVKSQNYRVISGNVLTGVKIAHDGHISFYHNQVTVIPEGDYYELLGWLKPSATRLSYHRAFGLFSFLNSKKKEYVLDTNTRGEERAFVQTGVFENVLPMDILPTYLIKAILAEDFDDMEALGIYEVVEEDLALCEFVDVSKHDIQAILREGINLLRYS